MDTKIIQAIHRGETDGELDPDKQGQFTGTYQK